MQYLRARYLKVETGTFTSRDTYAGRVRDILSQNRYTYAENNPVTYADPSGHKVTFGNMFGGGRDTGRNGGMGGIIGNTARTVVDKVTATAKKAQNTTRNTFNQVTGNHGATAKGKLDSIVAQAGGAITGTLGGGNAGGSPAVNEPDGMLGFAESVAAQVEVPSKYAMHTKCGIKLRNQ